MGLAMNPLALIGIPAIAAGLYMWKKHSDAATKAVEDQKKAVEALDRALAGYAIRMDAAGKILRVGPGGSMLRAKATEEEKVAFAKQKEEELQKALDVESKATAKLAAYKDSVAVKERQFLERQNANRALFGMAPATRLSEEGKKQAAKSREGEKQFTEERTKAEVEYKAAIDARNNAQIAADKAGDAKQMEEALALKNAIKDRQKGALKDSVQELQGLVDKRERLLIGDKAMNEKKARKEHQEKLENAGTPPDMIAKEMAFWDEEVQKIKAAGLELDGFNQQLKSVRYSTRDLIQDELSILDPMNQETRLIAEQIKSLRNWELANKDATQAQKADMEREIDANEVQKQRNQNLQEGMSLFEQFLSPQDKLIEKQGRLAELFGKGAITVETYGKALQKAQQEEYREYKAKFGFRRNEAVLANNGGGRDSLDEYKAATMKIPRDQTKDKANDPIPPKIDLTNVKLTELIDAMKALATRNAVNLQVGLN
jgi:hypothetical protein